MNQKERDFINIIKSGITSAPVSISSDFSAEELFEISEKHRVTAMLYYGLHNCRAELSEDMKNRFLATVMQSIVLDEKQREILSEIKEMFRENGIDHMVLKGGSLKELYPAPEMRIMGDIDILINLKQYKKILELFHANGYEEVKETHHELIWKKGDIMVELHKVLMPPYNEDFDSYFGNGWERAVATGDNEFSFNDEDMFIYLFAHFSKHYRDGGIGIRQLCDLYLFLNKKSLCEEYIKTELSKLGLYDFYINIIKTIKAWFEGGESSEICDFITEVIIKSGTFGDYESFVVAVALREKEKRGTYIKGRMTSIFRSMFPTLKSMKLFYPTLKKTPFLLPAFWVVRLFSILFREKDRVRNKLNDIASLSDEKVKSYEESLRLVGLKYDFPQK